MMSSEIADFLSNYPDDMQAISQILREMVVAAMPHANEILHASQNHIGYSPSQSSYDQIAYICPMQDYVRLGFMRGTALPDPDQHLIGEGKWLRHVKVRSMDQAKLPALAALVKAAWEYSEKEQAEKAAKKAAKARSK
jgi:hypothetical protein